MNITKILNDALLTEMDADTLNMDKKAKKSYNTPEGLKINENTFEKWKDSASFKAEEWIDKIKNNPKKSAAVALAAGLGATALIKKLRAKKAQAKKAEK